MVAESLEREIRDLRALLFSQRDPEGRGFAPLADALRRAGDLGQALELVREGVERLPEFATGHVVSGWVHRARGEDAEAEASFRRVLELDQENVSALRGLGFLLADRGDESEALDVFRRLDDLDPGDLEVRARLLELGRREAAPSDAGEAGGETGVVTIESLAPDEETPRVVDIGTLAPGPEGAGTGRAEEGAGSTDPAAAGRPVVDVEELAPDEARPAAVVDVESLAPEPTEGSDAAPDPSPGPEAEVPVASAGVAPLPGSEVDLGRRRGTEDDDGSAPWTRTMAELYVRQGFPERAVRIYRTLVEKSPGDDDLRARLEELEAAGAEGAWPRAAPVEDTEPDEEDARLEDLARHMAAGPAVEEDAAGPFAWGGVAEAGDEEDDDGEDRDEGADAPVSEYFRTLLRWTDGS